MCVWILILFLKQMLNNVIIH